MMLLRFSLCVLFALQARLPLQAQDPVVSRTFQLPLGSAETWNQPQGELKLSAAKQAGSLQVKAGPSAFLYTRRGILPSELSTYSHVRLHLLSEGEEASVIELQFLEQGGRGKFWRKINVPPGRRSQLELPLAYIRAGAGKQPHWDRVLFLGLFFRNGFEGTLEGIELVAKEGETAWMSPARLFALGFDGKGRMVIREGRLAVITDEEKLDAEKLADHLQRADTWIREQIPGLPPPEALPTLLVFQHQQDYRDFHRNLGKQLNAHILPPESDGYAVLGIASSSAADQPEHIRPVFVHEFVHAHLDKVVGIPSENGDWFQEGMANSVQLRFHPQENFKGIVQEGLENPDFRSSLQELCSGRRIPMKRYWQAVTVVDMLMEDPKYADAFPKLVKAMSDSGNTNLEAHWQQLPVSEWQSLEQDWKAFCRKQYR